MKRKTLIVLLIMLLTNGFCQTYNPIIEENKYWDIFDWQGEAICGYIYGGRYFFEGDTSISEVNYKIMRKYPIIQLEPGPYCPPFAVDSSQKYIVDFLREDTLEKRVYRYYTTENQEELLYDFTLNEGDSIYSLYANGGSTLVVDSIGFIELLNGEQRKTYYLNTSRFYIEGICSDQGFGAMIIGIGFETQVHCVQKEEMLYGYQCYDYVDILDNPTENIINIFYENNLKSISIESEKTIESVQVVDVFGKVIKSVSNVMNGKTEISFNNKSTGMYIVRVLSGQNIYVKTILVN